MTTEGVGSGFSIRRNIDNFNDVNYNFQMLWRVLIGHIGTPNLLDGAITGQKIAEAAVGSLHIQKAAVGSLHIDEAAVGSVHIQEAAIGSLHIQKAAVGSLHIDEAAVGSVHIQEAAITTAKINNLAVTTAKIGNLAVTNSKISSLSADKITAGTIEAAVEMTSATVTGGLIRTNASGARIELDDTGLYGYYSGNSIAYALSKADISNFGFTFLKFFNTSGTQIGSLSGLESRTQLDGTRLSIVGTNNLTLVSQTEIDINTDVLKTKGKVGLTGTFGIDDRGSTVTVTNGLITDVHYVGV